MDHTSGLDILMVVPIGNFGKTGWDSGEACVLWKGISQDGGLDQVSIHEDGM